MTSIILTAAAVTVVGYVWWLVTTAPMGWEDEDGFHLGEPDEDD